MTVSSLTASSSHNSLRSPPALIDDRIDTILAATDQSAEEKIRALLRLGVDALDLDYGYLSRVDPALRTLTVVITCGPNPAPDEGSQSRLASTFCRHTVVSAEPVSFYDASKQGFGEDPAYRASGVESYMSTRLLVDEKLYGALCFAARSPGEEPFTDDDYTLVEQLGRAVEQVIADRPPRAGRNDGEEDAPRMGSPLLSEPQLLERVFETSPSAIVILNASGEFVHVSARAQEILDLERDAVTNRTFDAPEWHITTPNGNPLPEEELPFARVRETEEAVLGMEHAIEWPDGSRRLLSVSGAPLHENGAFIGAVFHLDDITNRRRAKLSLEESEERFRGVFRNAALGIALLNARGRFVDANPVLTKMLGYTDPEAVRGRQYREVSHPADVAAEQSAYQDLVSGTREAYQIEKRFERRDGSTFWGHVTASVINGPGEARVVAMIEDIDRRREQRERLRLFREAVEQADEAAIILEAAPRKAPGPSITYANPAFGNLTGHDPTEAVGTPLGTLFGPESDEAVLEELWQALGAGRRHEGETVAYRADGTSFVAHWTLAPVRDRTGTITHWVSIHRDVTEQRLRGWRLIEAHDAERRRIDQEMHDQLGGLLTALQMTVDLARIEVQEEGGPTAPLDKVEARVDDLASAVRSITGRLHPKVLSDHGLSRALPSLVDSLKERHGRTIHLDVDLDAEERPPALLEATLYRVVQETLLYALRHTDGCPLNVTVEQRPRHLRVSVDCRRPLPAQDPAEGHLPVFRDIRRWIDQLDGTFTINHDEEASPKIEVTVPVAMSCLPEHVVDGPNSS